MRRASSRKPLGRPKSGSGERTIPLPPIVVNALREWKLQCAKSELGLVFPVRSMRNCRPQYIVRRGLWPARNSPPRSQKWVRILTARSPTSPNIRVCVAPFLCELVHQSQSRRGPRTPGEGGSGTPWALYGRHDTGYLWPSFPTACDRKNQGLCASSEGSLIFIAIGVSMMTMIIIGSSSSTGSASSGKASDFYSAVRTCDHRRSIDARTAIKA